ncbi:TPA: hypothetical protein HA243_05040 [Candidatus Micrarchaeota archaeon]|nr:hypothetical protein [Candidatus Micrarchaeota archaeon]
MKSIFEKTNTTENINRHTNVHHPNKHLLNSDLKCMGIVATIDKEHSGSNNAGGSRVFKSVKKLIEKPVNKLFVKMPWVAGEYAEDAVNRALELNSTGSPAIICCLGEHMSSRQGF